MLGGGAFSPSDCTNAFLPGIHDGDPAEGLSCALIWVLDFVESEHFAGDTRPRYWAVRCILDALVSCMFEASP